MTLRRFAHPIFPTLVALLLLSGGCNASEAKRAAAEGARLYEGGDYDAALPLLEKAAEKGLVDGELFYQLGYVYALKSMPEKSREYREKAVPLLEKRVESPKGNLEDAYYLAALFANLGRSEEMAKAAREAIGRHGEAGNLSGDDLFRLGRLYEFAGDGAKGAASYRRSVEAFEKGKDPGGTLYALALLADARTDYRSHRFAEASRKLGEAARISPRNAPAPFETALAHLGAGEFAPAREDFEKVQDSNLNTEAQYGADVARRLQASGGAVAATTEGKILMEMDNTALEEALRSGAASLRKEREDLEAGKGSADRARAAEQLFFSLAAEWMLRGNAIRESALSGGYADLIRR